PGNMRLYVRAKKPMMERIKKMVVQLDVPSGSGDSNDEIRIFPMRGRQAEQLVRTAAGFWREANAIVLYPAIFSEASSRRERVVASGGASLEPATIPSPQPAGGNPEVLAGDIRSPKAAIRCQLTPRGMLLECRDTVILDRFYRHLQSVAGPVSTRPSAPVIFYLKYTKPEEALRMLSELLDGGEAANLGEAGSLVNGYVGSAGSSLLGSLVVSREGTTTMTSGTITVVADSRLNRLIVQGTDDDIDVVESYLQIVDKDTGITDVETYGKSHVIELIHTRASDVATTIREAFAERVATGGGSAGRSQGGSSGQRGAEGSSRGFQQDSGRESSGREGGERSEGGDRRGSSQRGAPQKAKAVEPKLTVAVHEASNSLIVTAPEQLFKQVEALVKLIDSRNEQTIRIISHSQAGRVNSVLQQVIAGQPNISSSGSSTTPSRTGSSSPSRSSSGSRTGSSPPSRSSSGPSRSGSSPSSRSSGSSRGSGR
ncbi:MAG: secretin N-terminal domain-containing protein, partial [Pirellulaceae bacterium]